ncbi:MAG TPA: GDSL-type esterase/lipase family protein [Caulobacteraceae bacterium]
MDLRVCFIGDSYVLGQGDEAAVGWPGRVLAAARAEGADLTAYNLGVRAETGPQIAARLVAEVTPRLSVGDRKAVVIAFGANDISRGVPREDSLAAARRMLAWTAAQGFAAFLLPPPARPHMPEWDAKAAALTEAMAGLGAPFLNLREAVPDWTLWWDEAAVGDGSHPNGGGYSLISDAFSRWQPWRTWLFSTSP